MLSSVITKITSKLLFFISVIYSLYLLINGNNIPGGGFISALLITNLLVFLKLSQNIFLSIKQIFYIFCFGLIILFLVQILSLLLIGNFFIENVIFSYGFIKVSSLFLFDLSIYFIVISCLSLIISELFINKS